MIRSCRFAFASPSVLIAVVLTACSSGANSHEQQATRDETEPNNSLTTSNDVAVGQAISGVIAPPGDVDFFSFSAAAGDTIDLNIDAEVNGSALDAVLILLTSSGDTVSVNDDDLRTWDSRILIPIDSADTYIVAVTDIRSFEDDDPTGSSER